MRSANEPERLPTPANKSKIGSAAQFWLHDQDRLLIREFSAWLAGQRQCPTDTMVTVQRCAWQGEGRNCLRHTGKRRSWTVGSGETEVSV